MKNIFIAVLLLASSFAVQAQSNISWPFGKGTFVTKAETDTAIVVTNRMTFVDYGTLDKAISLTISVNKGLADGAFLFILTKSDATGRNVTFSTGFKAPVLSGTSAKTKLATFIYKGGTFYLITTQQLD
jgi:hypothetical protein